MNSVKEVIKYRGREISMCYDTDPECPNDWGNDYAFLVSYNRREFCTIPDGWENRHDALCECDGFYRGYYVFPVSIYSHSGVALCMGNRGGWDFSNGWAFALVKRDKGSWTREAACKVALSVIEEWNDYLSGNVYGYISGDDSCWGYYGDEGYKCAIEDAKACIDYAIKCEQVEFIARKKVELRHRIPMQYRSVWNFD